MKKRIYNFEKIRGVDVTSSPINVASNRASYMLNMINEGGVNKKRHGWRDIAWFEDNKGNKEPINGIFPFGDGYIVHAGTRFYKCDDEFEKEPAFAEIGNAENKKSKGYVQGGKLWIVCGGEYLVYDGNTIQPVMESMYAYIPTTSIGITAHNEGKKTEAFQGVNLFTKKRKNKLVGVTNTVPDGHTDGIYKLDGLIDMDEPFTLTLEAMLEDFEASYTNENGEDVTDKLNGQVIIIFKDKSYTVSGNVYVNDEGEKSLAAESFNKYYEFNGYCFDYYNGDDGRGYVKFGHMLSTPALEGESNITVEFTADYESDIIISASNTVGLSAGVDSLCLVNDGNVVYFSDILYGYGYFPDIDYIGIGSEDKPITALVTLDNGNVGVFKADELYGVKIGIKYIDEEYVVRLEPSITMVRYGIGCTNEHCAIQVNDDSLIYNAMGVHGMTGSQEKPVNMRSTNVNKELNNYHSSTRKDAFAVSHEGRYYLFIGGYVYIADTRFKTYESNRLDAGYEYEWWIWDNCPCICAYSFDGKLIMGTKNGAIREFSDCYVDENLIQVRSSNNEMSYDGTNFAFDEAIQIQDGDEVVILGALEKLNLEITKTTYIETEDELISCHYKCDKEIPSIYEGMRVSLFCEDERIDGEVVECDYSSYIFVVKRYNGDSYNSEYANEYVFAKDPGRYTVRNTDGEILLINEWGEKASFIRYDDISAVICRSQNVCCEMVTGIIDFYKLHAKTLFKLAITLSEDTVGEIEIGYETNLKRENKERYVGRGFDFADFDFKSFVFDGNFAKTFIKRVFERNFNYIRFRFASKSNGPFGIENAQVVYAINNEIRGDL